VTPRPGGPGEGWERAMRPMHQKGNVEAGNTMTTPGCECWTWAITPEMGEFREIKGTTHHPHCPVVPAPDSRREGER
jgi:hypothetical protein